MYSIEIQNLTSNMAMRNRKKENCILDLILV